MADRKADKANVGSGGAGKAKQALKTRRQMQDARLAEIMKSAPTPDRKK